MIKNIIFGQFLNPSKYRLIKSNLLFQNVQIITTAPIRWKSKTKDSFEDDISNVPRTILSNYEVFSEKSASIILDIEEERRKIEDPVKEEIDDSFKEIQFQRGETGVFELKELVELLKREKAQDVFVVKIPPEFSYADYMVIVTAISQRHLTAIAAFVRKIFKKKMSYYDHIPTTEGKYSSNWKAIDLDNIVLHIFTENTRKYYDLETLWSLGKEYDSLSNQKENVLDNVADDYSKMLADLIPLEPKEK